MKKQVCVAGHGHGQANLERSIDTLFVDQSDTGEAIRNRGLPAVFDAERWGTPALDYLLKPGDTGSRLGLTPPETHAAHLHRRGFRGRTLRGGRRHGHARLCRRLVRPDFFGDGMMAEFSFHHGGVSVPSLDAAIDWYGRILGFELERRFFIAEARAQAAFVRKGDLRFEIFEVEGAASLPEERRHPPSDLKTHGNKHVAFRIADLDAFLAEMEEKGADIAFVVRRDYGAGCFLRDCAGNLVEFVVD